MLRRSLTLLSLTLLALPVLASSTSEKPQNSPSLDHNIITWDSPLLMPGSFEKALCDVNDARTEETNANVKAAVARLVNAEGETCTGFLIDTGDPTVSCMISAGRCFVAGDAPNVVVTSAQFDVPQSGADCSLNAPASEKIFEIDATSVVAANADGDDWAVFRLLRNATTGKTAGEEQGSALALALDDPMPGTPVSVSGYGRDPGGVNICELPCEDKGFDDRTLQTADGILLPGPVLTHNADICSGNEGSPVIADTGVVGIHTGNGCGERVGPHLGTRITNENLQAALAGCSSAATVIVIDRSGSMQAVRGTGNTRCHDAVATARLDIEQFFADFPESQGSQAAVFTFQGTTYTDLTGGFVDQAAALAAVDSLNPEGCQQTTPLADALCGAADLLANAGVSKRFIAISSDGNENTSSGPCAGPASGSDQAPYDSGSWHNKVYDKIVNQNGIVISRFWTSINLNPVPSENGEAKGEESVDQERGGQEAPSIIDFLAALAAATGGNATVIDDDDTVLPPPSFPGPPAQFQVNADVAGRQAGARVALQDGNVAFVWESGSPTTIQARIFDLQGAPLTNQFPIGSGASPSVAFNINGDLFFAWSDNGTWVRRFDTGGNPLGSAIRVDSDSPGTTTAIASYDGGLVVGWAYLNSVRLRRLDSMGQPAGDAWIAGETMEDNSGVKLEVSDNGIVAVTALNPPSNESFLRIFDENNVALSPMILLQGVSPDVTFTSPSTLLVSDNRRFEIVATPYDLQGNPIGSSVSIGAGYRQQMQADAFGNVFFAWQNGNLVEGRLLMPNGSLEQRRIVSSTPSDALQTGEILPDVAGDQLGNFVITWSSIGSPGNDSDESVQGRIYCLTCEDPDFEPGPFFADGFESGDTTGWSASVPVGSL